VRAIPADGRREVGLIPGTPLPISVTRDADSVVSTPAAGLWRARQLVSRHVESGDSLVDELLAERRDQAADE
jgi:hypothetical protein